MALGATMRSVARMVLWQSARPVVLGLVIGAALAKVLEATSAASLVGDRVHVFAPLAYL